MLLFAYGVGDAATSPLGAGLLHGLKLVAVAIVAQAVLGMARTLCPDRARAAIAAFAVVLLVIVPGSAGQIGAIFAGGAAGLVLCRDGRETPSDSLAIPISRKAGAACLGVFFLVLAASFVPARHGAVALFDAFYRAGALVFGGGHVVLPLLRDGRFLAGYGAAQALPGPLFTFSVYLGAVASVKPGGLAGGAVALLAISLPGLLALVGAAPFWNSLRSDPAAQAVMRGVNAAVVGLLAAALYDPVWVSAVQSPADFAVVVVGFVLLVAWRAPPLLVVLLSAAAGIGLAMAQPHRF
jgi:chromate transporter